MNTGHAKPSVVIVTPAWADANNGNWQTARRWARLLASKHTVLLTDRWPDGKVQVIGARRRACLPDEAAVMIALHARRSAASIQAWHEQRGAGGLAVVLTGTDLYKDLSSADPAITEQVERSLQAAAALVVLQDHARQDLPAPHRTKARVIYQSATARRTLSKSDPNRHLLRSVMVGHLRDEKDPQTLQAAAALLRGHAVRIDHWGAALEPRFEQEARLVQSRCATYRWRGACTHEQARRRIQQAHVLVHTSRMEGGAHVIMEAIRSGTPVLASRMAGNLGMLGSDYVGYFPVGDAPALASALLRFRSDRGFRDQLIRQCEARAALFDPAREAESLEALIRDLARRQA